MKLVMAIVKESDDREVIRELVANNFRVTRMASTGGFLRQGNVTLMIGTEEERVDEAVNIIRLTCKEPGPGQHRATIFVLNAVLFEQT